MLLRVMGSEVTPGCEPRCIVTTYLSKSYIEIREMGGISLKSDHLNRVRTERRKKDAVLDLGGEEYVSVGTQPDLVKPVRFCQYSTPESFSRDAFPSNPSLSGSCSV